MPKSRQRESDLSNDSSPLQKSGLDCRFSKRQRLVSSLRFQETFAQQQRWVGRYMVLWRRSGEGAALRLGVITSKKVSLRAHDRNRVRRRMREAWRTLRPQLTGSYDVILVGRRALLDADWAEVTTELKRLAQRAGLLESSKPTEHGNDSNQA